MIERKLAAAELVEQGQADDGGVAPNRRWNVIGNAASDGDKVDNNHRLGLPRAVREDGGAGHPDQRACPEATSSLAVDCAIDNAKELPVSMSAMYGEPPSMTAVLAPPCASSVSPALPWLSGALATGDA